MKTTTLLLATLILAVLAMNCSAQCSDPLSSAAMATVISGPKGNSVINDNGRAAFVSANGNGTGVIFQDRGTTTVQKIGDTTFIVPSGNPVAPGSGRQP